MGLWYQRIKGIRKGARNCAGKPIVFLHGAGSNHTVWKPYIPCFAEHDILIADLPGHGMSQQSAFNSIEHTAREIEKILINEQLTSTIILGQSLGGIVGLELAISNPSLVSSIVVASPLGHGLFRAPTFWRVIANAFLHTGNHRKGMRCFQDYSTAFNQPFYRYPWLDMKGTEASTVAKAAIEVMNYAPQWSLIKQPSIILIGRFDPFINKPELIRQTQVNPRITIKEVPTHHLVVTHAKDHVLEAVKGFAK